MKYDKYPNYEKFHDYRKMRQVASRKLDKYLKSPEVLKSQNQYMKSVFLVLKSPEVGKGGKAPNRNISPLRILLKNLYISKFFKKFSFPIKILNFYWTFV